MNHKGINKVKYDQDIIQVKLLNVEKNSLFISDIFKEISKHNVNIDMISQVMLEDEMRIDFTCFQKDQNQLNRALELIKKKHPRMMIYQNRKVAKMVVEGDMKDEVGVAADIFDILGKKQIPLHQVTTSDTTISYVIPEDMIQLAVEEIRKTFDI